MTTIFANFLLNRKVKNFFKIDLHLAKLRTNNIVGCFLLTVSNVPKRTPDHNDLGFRFRPTSARVYGLQFLKWLTGWA